MSFIAAVLSGSNSSSQLDELLDKATSENMPAGSEDMALNLEMCDLIKGKQVPANYAMKAMKKRLNHRNPNVQLLTLKLVDVCVKNGGHHFLVEIASREFMDNLESLLNPAASTHPDVTSKILSLIQTWGLAFRGKNDLYYAVEMYESLKRQGKRFPPVSSVDSSSIMIDTRTAPEWSDSDWCMRCRTAFTTFNRKHHCRNCGLTFCGSCSLKSIALPHLGITQEVRVCDDCFGRVSSGQKQVPSSVAVTASSQGYPADTFSHQEDDDLKKAIEASLRESQRSSQPPPKKQVVKFKQDEEEDADLKAAIEASLRESQRTSSRPAPSSNNAAPNYTYQSPYEKRSNSTSSHTSSTSVVSRTHLDYPAPVATVALNPNELSQLEMENIRLFSELVERMEQDFATRGPAILNNPQIQTLYVQIGSLQSKLTKSLEDVSMRYQQYLQLNDKLSASTKMYDQMLQERLNVATLGRVASAGGLASYGNAYYAPPATGAPGYPATTGTTGYPAAGAPAGYPTTGATGYAPATTGTQGYVPTTGAPAGYPAGTQGYAPATTGAPTGYPATTGAPTGYAPSYATDPSQHPHYPSSAPPPSPAPYYPQDPNAAAAQMQQPPPDYSQGYAQPGYYPQGVNQAYSYPAASTQQPPTTQPQPPPQEVNLIEL